MFCLNLKRLVCFISQHIFASSSFVFFAIFFDYGICACHLFHKKSIVLDFWLLYVTCSSIWLRLCLCQSHCKAFHITEKSIDVAALDIIVECFPFLLLVFVRFLVDFYLFSHSLPFFLTLNRSLYALCIYSVRFCFFFSSLACVCVCVYVSIATFGCCCCWSVAVALCILFHFCFYPQNKLPITYGHYGLQKSFISKRSMCFMFYYCQRTSRRERQSGMATIYTLYSVELCICLYSNPNILSSSLVFIIGPLLELVSSFRLLTVCVCVWLLRFNGIASINYTNTHIHTYTSNGDKTHGKIDYTFASLIRTCAKPEYKFY